MNNPLLKPTGIQITIKSFSGPTTRENRILIGAKTMSLGIDIPTVSTRFSLSMEMSRLTRDWTAETVSRDQILRHARGRGNIIFPVQLTTSRIGNLTRLIHTLLYVMTIHNVSRSVNVIPFLLGRQFCGRTIRGHTGRRSLRIPPPCPFVLRCLPSFFLGKVSNVPFPCRRWNRFMCTHELL